MTTTQIPVNAAVRCLVPWCAQHIVNPLNGDAEHHSSDGRLIGNYLTAELFRAERPGVQGDTQVSIYIRGVTDDIDLAIDDARALHRRLGYLLAIADNEDELADFAKQLASLAAEHRAAGQVEGR